MKWRPTNSLRFDLIFDLSLLTLTALILSQGILLMMMRTMVPEEMVATWRAVTAASHRSFLRSEFIEGLSQDVPQEWEEAYRRFSSTEDGETLRLQVSRVGERADAGQMIVREPYLIFFDRIESIRESFAHENLVFTYEISFISFHALLNHFKVRSFVLMFFIEILLVLVGYFLLFRRNIIVPIQNLGRFAREFLNENWNARCSVERRDELGQVAEALNEMASKIQDKERKLTLTIDSLKQANAELEARQHEQLQIEKLASIGRLAAGVAHEVGNPLGAILGYVDILRRVVEKEGIKEDLEIVDRIESETHRISKIIRALLQQARPTKERIRAVKLKPVLVRALQLAQVPSAIDIEFDFEDDEAEVMAEEDQLVQVFLNLIANAKHAIEEYKARSERGRLILRCKLRKLPVYKGSSSGDKADYDTSVVRSLKPETYWVVNIEDNGTGISVSNQKKLFEPFFSTKAPGKGTGLGLYVTKSIVESFRGAVVVRSAEGYGAAFSIFLPRSRSNFPTDLMNA